MKTPPARRRRAGEALRRQPQRGRSRGAEPAASPRGPPAVPPRCPAHLPPGAAAVPARPPGGGGGDGEPGAVAQHPRGPPLTAAASGRRRRSAPLRPAHPAAGGRRGRAAQRLPRAGRARSGGRSATDRRASPPPRGKAREGPAAGVKAPGAGAERSAPGKRGRHGRRSRCWGEQIHTAVLRQVVLPLPVITLE